MNPESVLRTFSQLASPSTDRQTDVLTDERLFVPQMYSVAKIFKPSASAVHPYPGRPLGERGPKVDERLLSAAALHKNENLLRVGWLWFSGTTTNDDGTSTQYCVPALSIPVQRLGGLRRLANVEIEPVGDAEITDLIDDPDVRATLLAGAEFGGGGLSDSYKAELDEYLAVDSRLFKRMPRLNAWIASLARALDLRVDELAALHEKDPRKRRKEEGICVHVSYGMYLDRPATVGTRRESLLRLANLPKLNTTAFTRLYESVEGSEVREPQERVELVDQLRPLSVHQRRIASSLRSTPLSVLSGAPGTGKSHLLTVVALDAVERGQSVLVAAASPFAVDVLVDHFAAAPGPTPVVFGGSSHGKRLATELATLVSARADADPTDQVADEHRSLEESAARMLDLESEALRIERDPARRIRQADDLRRAGDLLELEELIGRIERGGVAGWVAQRRVGDEVAKRLGDGEYRAKLDQLHRAQDAQMLLSAGGLTLATSLDHMAEVEDQAAEQRGRLITTRWLDGLSASHRRALTRISTALTSDRGTRRRMFQALNPADLVGAAPLWVGSVRDIDEVLPQVAGMFDLVILDEAAQIDQLNAANALVRARRAIVCGDPEQIGHVSFLSDADLAAAAALHDTDAEVLDPRRQSTFDAAAAAAPVYFLDEHFRSAPHLIEFSARQIYRNGLHIASRHPRNEAADHIDVHVVDGSRNSKKVNDVEVAECLRVADEFIAKGWTGIGFVSPFRAQADAIEEAVLERYRLDEIEHYGLRVGTVHSFQGDERKLMIASWAIGEAEGNGAWRFVNQKNAFNVMVTRAREHMVVVTSTKKPPGLAGEYVRWSEPLTDLIGDAEVTNPWVQRVAGALRDAGVDARTGYRTGRHIVDVVIGSGASAIAVDCSPHAQGPAAHLDRAMQLRRTGWHTADAFQSRWDGDLGRLAVELAGRYESLRLAEERAREVSEAAAQQRLADFHKRRERWS